MTVVVDAGVSPNTALLLWTALCAIALAASVTSVYIGHWLLGIVGLPLLPLAFIGAFGTTKPTSLRQRRLDGQRRPPLTGVGS